MQAHPTVSREEWLKARRALLAKEKAHPQGAGRAAPARRRALPWVKVEKELRVRGAGRPRDARPTCSPAAASSSSSTSCWARTGRRAASAARSAPTSIDGSVVHLVNHDVMLVAVSRAPYPEDRRLPQAHGLALQVGVVVRLATSTSTSTSPSPKPTRPRARRSTISRAAATWATNCRACSVFTKDEPRPDFPHLFRVRPRLPSRSSARSTASSTSPPRAATSRPAAT